MINPVAGKLLHDLLAIIHRDGGHHTAEVGLCRSLKDAEAVITALRTDLDRATQQIKDNNDEWNHHSCYPRDGND